MQSSNRRHEREAQKRLRALEQQAKEQAKLSAIAQARLEVDYFENQIELLQSIHKEQGEDWDWQALAAALPPHAPQQRSRHETRLRQLKALGLAAVAKPPPEEIENGRRLDETEYQQALAAHSHRLAEWKRFKELARRILAGEHKAYADALLEVNPFAEIRNLGSAIHFTVHHAKLLECSLKVNGKQAIPSEVKALTATEKLSVKPMPKGRFQELYQDYLCSCVLRAARELFALLPIENVLINATADCVNPQTAHHGEMPVLSVWISRDAARGLKFDALDPSDTIEDFPHRGDLKLSRKSGSFQPVIPLTAADFGGQKEDLKFEDLVSEVQKLRAFCKAETSLLTKRGEMTSNQAASRS